MTTDDDQARRTSGALADTARLTGAACRQCDAVLCGHEAVIALVLGYKNAPRCLACIAAHMRDTPALLRERTLTYIRRHECFDAAWRRAGELEGSLDAVRPACVWRAGAVAASAPSAPVPSPSAPAPVAAVASPAAVWDAGAMGCGDLVLELRLRLAGLPPGGVLELRAEDPGAPVDLPAWCNVTGHVLLGAAHPNYRIRRRD